MAYGDVHGCNGVAGAEDEADELRAVAKLGGVAGGGAGRGVLAGEPAFGHADGRQVEEESQVAGNAEAPGVRVAVAVDEDEVRGVFEALEGEGEQGDFAESEEAGDIGEGDGGLEDVVLDEMEVRVGEDNDGGAGEALRHAGSAARFQLLRVSGLRADEGDVGGGYEADACGIAGGDDARGEAGLDGGGLPGGEGPGVEGAETHGDIVAAGVRVRW